MATWALYTRAGNALGAIIPERNFRHCGWTRASSCRNVPSYGYLGIIYPCGQRIGRLPSSSPYLIAPDMPGPGNKRKSKAKANTKANTENAQASSTLQSTRTEVLSAQCLTLEEDELTRCGQPATEGYPKPDRCKAHHGQYRVLYKKYKDASTVVDEVKHEAELPTKEQIGRYTDWRAALGKARWVRKYLEAIRVEKTGREIHQKRFFLKGKRG